MVTGTLYIVATPIGNLEDITYRAIRVLKEADLIFCEDTRVTKKLLDKYEITAETRSFYKSGGNGARKPVPNFEYILSELKSGKNVAFVTDAGTPGISDPGNTLVQKALAEGIIVTPIPGVSALTTIVSVAGVDLSRVVFMGFPPHKKGRETFFNKLISYDIPVIYYESPHRLIKNLELLSILAPERNIIIGRELTKLYEEILRGGVNEILDFFERNNEKVKGEFVVIVY
ncbi:MAG TPA: 16S rRNA (cytidine(1402)-2'-O)-methyltransferase [Patescibacteria group bacterium]|nr:16S rRNA (cytidine(1402)-2'-O)-methyltransferase [Patescibacteria group bacterium]